MSSRFHEELVSARRRGEAPGMADEDPPAALAVTFSPSSEGVPSLDCDRCGALVSVPRIYQHAAWHVQMGD